MSEVKEKKSKPLECVVVSDRMQKSRTAVLERLVKHPRIGKYLRRKTKIMFHDEENQSKTGDKVLIAQCRPHSLNKRFTLVEIVEKGVAEQ